MRTVTMVVSAFLGIAMLCGSAGAQSATASILGQVTDPQGAAVPRVMITVTNVTTNVPTKVETDGEGNYRVLNLPIGSYVITAEHAGFAKMATDRVALEINQQARVNLQLQVGAVSQTVEVSGVASTIETVNPTLGQSVTSRPIVNLPLNGRNVLNLALLQPGVTEDNPDDNNGQGIGGVSGFSVGGGRADSVTYLLDGGANNDLLGNEVVYNPNPDSVAEFRILTSNYTAEYGRNGAGIISVVTKSGTNHLHGSAFDFARNTDFDANSYFNIQAGLPRNDLKRQQFGGTIGGPVSIPRLFSGKDRAFFFIAYQGQRQTQTQVESQTTTFTPAELNGDFSQAANGAPDPAVAAFLQANPYFQANPALAAQAMIDPTKIDPAAAQYIAAGLVPASPSGLLSSAAGSKDNNNELTGKLDFNITANDRLSATVGGTRNPQIQPFGISDIYGATVGGYPSTNQINSYFSNLAYTRTFSPTVLNDMRVTAQRHYQVANNPATSLPNASQLGFGIASDLPNGPPLMSFDNGLAFGANQAGPSYESGNTYAFTEALTWVKGHNTWKFGGGFSAYQNNTLYDFFGDGSYTFIGPYNQGGIGTGNSLADFLVGIPNNLFEGPNARNNFRSKATYGFLQDEWRATKRLTLTLGIRYEYSTPNTDTQGRTFSIVPGDQSSRFPNAPLGLVFPGDAGAPRGVNFPDKDNFAPRFGFAWDPWGSGKTSFRGGVGIFYDVLKGEDNLQFNGAPPFYSEQFAGYACPAQNVDPATQFCTAGSTANPGYPSQTAFYSNPWIAGGFSGNPFPSTPPTAGSAFANGQFIPFGGGGIYFVDPHLHTPYTYQYNLSLQHQLAGNLTSEISYVGSSSKGLTSLEDVNPFVLGTADRVLNLSQNAGFASLCGSLGGTADCPLSNALEFKNISFANFNSLETSVTKQPGETRFLGTTYFTLAYTYGHSIDNASGFRNRDSQVPFYSPGQFRSSSDFDITQRITFSGGWDLPFDRAWGSGPRRLIKGWSLYPILSWRTGFPLSINAGESLNPQDPGPSGAGDANLVNAAFAPGFNSISLLNPHSPSTLNGTTGNFYFNPAAFTVPTSGYGLPRDFFRGPGRTNLDMALAKTTPITESLSVEFRVEAFNVFNHPEFASPDININSGTFGQITSTDLGTGLNTLHTERILQLAARVSF
jgi:Carboxypeptidase regulatory-like domain